MGVRIVWSPNYTLDWPGHVFPVLKYRLVREALLREGIVRPEEILAPDPASNDLLRLVHPDAYLHRLEGLTAIPEKGLREFEVPVSKAGLRAVRREEWERRRRRDDDDGPRYH